MSTEKELRDRFKNPSNPTLAELRKSMEENGHSPSPWTTSREDMDSYTRNPDSSSTDAEHVVYVYRGSLGDVEGGQPRIPVFAGPLNNARPDAALIASAPELLAMLKRIELQLSTRTDMVIQKLMGEARAAIDKASK